MHLSERRTGPRAMRLGIFVRGMVAGYWFFYGVFFLGPLLCLVSMSLRTYEMGRPQGGLGLQNFRSVLAGGSLLPALAKSIAISGLVAVLCAGIGLLTVLGAFAVRRRGVQAGLLLTCALMFFAGSIPRTFAAEFLFSENGPFRSTWGLLGEDAILLYSLPGVVLGYLPLMLPPAILALFVAREAVGSEVVDAAADLGAGWWLIQARVVVPLMQPGLVVAVLLTFVLTVADVIVVDLLGGAHVYTAAMVILDYVKIDDWGRAAAASILLLTLAMAGTTLSTWALERRVTQ